MVPELLKKFSAVLLKKGPGVAVSANKGFSFIEMLVVMVLMAILAVIAIPMYKESKVDAYAPEAEAVLASISASAQRYRVYNGNSFTGMTLSTLQSAPYNVKTNTTNKWSFSLPSVTSTGFTAVASGNGAVVPVLSGKTITLSFDLNGSPQETITQNW